MALIDLTGFAIAILVIVVGWLINIAVIKRLTSPLVKIPGPRSWSLMGNIMQLMREEAGDPQLRWSLQYGKIFRIELPFTSERVVVMDADLIKQILVTNSKKYRKPERFSLILGPIIGNGLFLLEGQQHAHFKKIINPAFKFGKIKAMMPIFQRLANVLADKWSKIIDSNDAKKTDICVQEELSKLTLDIVCKTAFGYDCNSIIDDSSQISQSFSTILQGAAVNWRNFIPFYKSLPTSTNLKVRRSLNLTHQLVDNVIDEKMKTAETATDVSCLLDEMISLKNENNAPALTKQQLHDQVMTFMLAGHETTSVALTWTLYALAKNPDIQHKVRKEIQSLLKDCDEISSEKLEELIYFNNVIKESLRLYTPGSLVVRQALRDDHLGGYYIPKNTIIIIMFPHKHPDYFEDPETFNPDRWDSTAKDVNPYAYLPFLIGPRMCIGNKFALLELKLILVKLLSTFSFDVVPNFTFKRKHFITMKPDPNLRLLVSPVIDSY